MPRGVKASAVVVNLRNYNVVGKTVIEGELESVVKKVAQELLGKWDPSLGDFMVLRDDRVIRLKLPLRPPELYDKLKPFNLTRSGNEAEATIPVYEIISSGSWVEDNLNANDVTLVMPYITDDITDRLIADVIESLKSSGFTEE